MSPATLRSYTCKDLARMAKERGVPGWHAMRKDELVTALVKLSRKKRANRNGKHKGPVPPHKRGKLAAVAPKKNPRTRRRISQLQSKLEQIKNLAANQGEDRVIRDRLVVMVRDPYWLHAYWEVAPQSVDRARAAMAQAWHAAKPVLRLYHVHEDGSSVVSRDIEIHGGVRNWYVDVQDPPQTFRMEIGYRSEDGSFFCLARSNTVTTPPAGTSDALDDNWADVAENADRIFAMSGGYSPQGTSQELQELMEERLRRPMGSPMKTRFGAGAHPADGGGDGFEFAVDAELIVYGVSRRDAHVTLKGEPVQMRSDGTFAVRLNMPDRRQVIPVVASSGDGVEQRTIVLAVERNTKVMEPVVRDSST